jgi:hypothetical protein
VVGHDDSGSACHVRRRGRYDMLAISVDLDNVAALSHCPQKLLKLSPVVRTARRRVHDGENRDGHANSCRHMSAIGCSLFLTSPDVDFNDRCSGGATSRVLAALYWIRRDREPQPSTWDGDEAKDSFALACVAGRTNPPSAVLAGFAPLSPLVADQRVFRRSGGVLTQNIV